MAAFTKASAVLAVEVDEGIEDLAVELRKRGLRPTREGRAVLVRLASTEAESDAVYDTIRDAIADLGLPLNRLEQRRHRVEELFADNGEGSGEAGGGGRAGDGARDADADADSDADREGAGDAPPAGSPSADAIPSARDHQKEADDER